jgi:hypothetical protein
MVRRKVRGLVLALGAAAACAATDASAQECHFCEICGPELQYRQLCGLCASNWLIEGPVSIECDEDAEECLDLGPECEDGGLLAAARKAWEAVRRGEHVSVLALARRFPEQLRYLEAQRALLVTTRCSGGRPIFALPVSAAEASSLSTILHRRAT